MEYRWFLNSIKYDRERAEFDVNIDESRTERGVEVVKAAGVLSKKGVIMQKTLDISIKKHEIGTVDGGYVAEGGKTYYSYMDNQKWDEFKKDMEQNHRDAFEEYGAGSGGELKPKGKYPPKMASYGSSSRMIYNLCKDIPNFHFEYQLPTKVGGIANLDGFLEKDDDFIFVEAKCREPYGVKSHMIERKYEELYRYINNDNTCDLNIRTENADSKMNVTFSVGDRVISSFDIKQMICYLLGMAVKFLNVPTDRKITFLYLCYNPKHIEITDDKKEASIFATYDQMCGECNAINFGRLWESTVKYLSSELKIGKATEQDISVMLANFKFILCDQCNYFNYLN